MVVGGEAVIHYGYARLTGDIDVFFDGTGDNATRLFTSLREFWHGEVPEIRDAGELLQPGAIFQFGVPPNRIDLLNRIDGVTFDECWQNRVGVRIPASSGSVEVIYIGIAELIKNKTAAGRDKDLDDLRFLRRMRG